MQIQIADIHWLDDVNELSITELAELSGLTEGELRELVEIGAIVPVEPAATRWTFRTECVVTVKTAVRLRNDFDLDERGLYLSLTLLDRIHELEAQLRALHARLPRSNES